MASSAIQSPIFGKISQFLRISWMYWLWHCSKLRKKTVCISRLSVQSIGLDDRSHDDDGNPLELRIVHVRVCLAKNLAKKDVFGASDPYVKLTLYSQRWEVFGLKSNEAVILSRIAGAVFIFFSSLRFTGQHHLSGKMTRVFWPRCKPKQKNGP